MDCDDDLPIGWSEATEGSDEAKIVFNKLQAGSDITRGRLHLVNLHLVAQATWLVASRATRPRGDRGAIFVGREDTRSLRPDAREGKVL